MDSKPIGNLAETAVIESIIMSEYLSPHINIDDKEPSFDGHIYVYDKKGHKKENIIGRVAVQIKGKTSQDLSKNEISYPIKMADLNNFLSVEGVMFFVVYITASNEKQIYYCSLLPVNLKRLIQDAAGQKTKTVKFHKFPIDNDKKREIFVNFLEDHRKQASFAYVPLPSLKELKSSGELINLKVYVKKIGEKDYKTAYIDNDVYIYAMTKGSDAPQPLDILPEEIIKKRKLKASIKINGTEWYSEYTVVTAKNERYLQIGNSYRIFLSENNNIAKITYKNSNMLRVLVKDLEFFLAYLEYGELYINDLRISTAEERSNLTNFNVLRQKERLIYLKKVVLVLDQLGYKRDLDIDELSEQDGKNINGLVTGLIEKKPVYFQKSISSQLSKLSVADAVFGLYLEEDDEESGAYNVYDFFEKEIPAEYIDETGESVSTSQYAFLCSEDLCKLTNLRTEVLLPSFKKHTSDKDAWGMATVFLLKLLRAYDLSNGEKVELLDEAFSFAKWAEELACEGDERLISRLNCLQVIKRNRSFNPYELNELYDMVDDENIDTKNKVEIHLLLDNQPMAKYYFKKLDKDQQEELTENPIYSANDFM